MALFATLVVFLIANTVPGDPILAQLGDIAASDKEFVAIWRAKYGLDLPLWERYFIFLKGILNGDLGMSIASQRPVLDDIRSYAPATIELATVAFILSIAIGVPLGIVAAVKRDTWVDHVARRVSLVCVSSPTCWRAGSMLESMQQDYVRVARAKGMKERNIVMGHVLPNALIPVVTLGGLAYANLLTGAVMTETIFSWPGLGRYTFRSAAALDFPAIMGITLIVAVTYLIINLLIDISYALLDPRVVR